MENKTSNKIGKIKHLNNIDNQINKQSNHDINSDNNEINSCDCEEEIADKLEEDNVEEDNVEEDKVEEDKLEEEKVGEEKDKLKLTKENNIIKEIIISCDKNLDCINNVVNLNDNICLVDLSYMVFTRFFAVRKWYEIKYSKDKPKWKIPNDYNWLEDNEFMAKYHKLFYEKLFNLCYKNNIPKHNIVFIMDCRHNDNWRVKLQDDYKGTRKDSHEKNRFFSYGIFDYVRNKLIPDLQEETRNIVLKTHDLEADDIIACLVKYFKIRKYDKKTLIITSDKDYFQLCDNKNICCYDLSGKNISHNTLKEFNNNSFQYLIFKILLGDPSDNIPSCYISKSFLKMANIKTNKSYLKCSKIVINKFLNVECCKKLLMEYVEYIRDKQHLDKVLLENKWFNKLEIFESITKDKQFESNAILIDFENIPLKHRNNVNEIFDKIFKN